MLTVYNMTLFYPLEQKEINVELLNCSIFMYKTLGGFCADFVLSTVNVIIDSPMDLGNYLLQISSSLCNSIRPLLV